MDKLLASLGGLGGSEPDLSALQNLMGKNGPLSKMMPNMDEMNEVMQAMMMQDVRPKYVCGPGVSEDMLYETTRWPVVYPQYLDSERTLKQGRRVAKERAVPHPVVEEVAEACQALGLRWVMEDKCYPRDFLVRGRVRVELFNEDKTRPVVATICNRFVLFQQLAQVIPHTNTRRARDAAAAESTETKELAAKDAVKPKETAKAKESARAKESAKPKRGGKSKKRGRH